MPVATPDQIAQEPLAVGAECAHEPAPKQPDPALSAITLPRVSEGIDLMAPTGAVYAPIRPDRRALVDALGVANAFGAVSDEAIRCVMRDGVSTHRVWGELCTGLTQWGKRASIEQPERHCDLVARHMAEMLPVRHIAARALEAAHFGYIDTAQAHETARAMRSISRHERVNADRAMKQVSALADAIVDGLNAEADGAYSDSHTAQIGGDRDAEVAFCRVGETIMVRGGDDRDVLHYASVDPRCPTLVPMPFDQATMTGPEGIAIRQAIHLIDHYLRPVADPAGVFEFFAMFYEEVEDDINTLREALGVTTLAECSEDDIEQAMDEAMGVGAFSGMIDCPEMLKHEDRLYNERKNLEQNWSPHGGDREATAKDLAASIDDLKAHSDTADPRLLDWLCRVHQAVATHASDQTPFHVLVSFTLFNQLSAVLTPCQSTAPELADVMDGPIEHLSMQMNEGSCFEEDGEALVGWQVPLASAQDLARRSVAANDLLIRLSNLYND